MTTDVAAPVYYPYVSLYYITSAISYNCLSLFTPCCVQIMKEIQEHKIKIYEFPETDDEEEMKMVRKIKVCSSKLSLH